MSISSRKSIREAQQELGRNCGLRSEIIWDLLPPNEDGVLKRKIEELIPNQTKGQKAIEEIRANIFNSVWKQRKYTNKTSITNIFYVMVTKDESFQKAPHSTVYSCHPVFRCKKCDKGSDTSSCCMIYVDEAGRVYENWKSYVEENVLPAGTMVLPRRGIYNFDRNDQVILDIYCTPKGTPESKAMSAAQSGSAVMGLGAACVPAAALFLPVAAPLVAAASFIGLGVGAFTTLTSIKNLNDRARHGQSISLENREARSCYLGVLGGTVGVAAAGATRVMSSMASAGKATKGIEVLVNGMNISSIALSGSGVANGVLDLIFKYNDGDEISSMDILQLSASLVLFTHSVYNFRLASHIANNARNNTIKSYRDTLSNRQRKMFDKMSKETMRIRGGTQGKMDIIRGANEIPDRQYLNNLYKINKQLNQRNVRPSFGKSGKNIILNNEVPVNTAELRQNVQHQQGPNILEQVTQPIPSTHNTDTYTTQTPKEVRVFFSNQDSARVLDAAVNEDNWETSLQYLAVKVKSGAVIMFNSYGKCFLQNISDISKFKDIVSSMFENLNEDTANLLIKLCQNFIEECKSAIEQTIKIAIPTESILYRILTQVLNEYADVSCMYISKKVPEIFEATKRFFLRSNSTDSNGRRLKCPDCNGVIILSQL